MKPKTINFIVLALILGSGIYTFNYVGQDSSMQLVVGILTAVSYVAWGLIHHAIQKDLHRKVVVEYILIGVIAIIVLFALIRS